MRRRWRGVSRGRAALGGSLMLLPDRALLPIVDQTMKDFGSEDQVAVFAVQYYKNSGAPDEHLVEADRFRTAPHRRRAGQTGYRRRRVARLSSPAWRIAFDRRGLTC